MKTPFSPLLTCVVIFCMAGALNAQTTVVTNTESWGGGSSSRDMTFSTDQTGERDFENSIAGLNLNYGHFLDELLTDILEESVSYSSSGAGGALWNGAARIALDHYFSGGALRPFLGVNFGRIHTDSGITDTWTAGFEGGAKYYLQPRTFVHTTVEYGWFFDRGRNLSNRFNDGQWSWSMGLGFKF